jgi:hypothetical protein
VTYSVPRVVVNEVAKDLEASRAAGVAPDPIAHVFVDLRAANGEPNAPLNATSGAPRKIISPSSSSHPKKTLSDRKIGRCGVGGEVLDQVDDEVLDVLARDRGDVGRHAALLEEVGQPSHRRRI